MKNAYMLTVILWLTYLPKITQQTQF